MKPGSLVEIDRFAGYYKREDPDVGMYLGPDKIYPQFFCVLFGDTVHKLMAHEFMPLRQLL